MEFFVISFSGMLLAVNLRMLIMYHTLYQHIKVLERHIRMLDVLFVISIILSSILFTMVIINPSGIIQLNSLFIVNINYLLYLIITYKFIKHSNMLLGLGNCLFICQTIKKKYRELISKTIIS